jgi:hypothetical protein
MSCGSDGLLPAPMGAGFGLGRRDVTDELTVVAVADAADDAAGEGVDDEGHVDDTRPNRTVRKARHPEQVRPWRLEAAVHPVVRTGRGPVAHRRAPDPSTAGPWRPVSAHRPRPAHGEGGSVRPRSPRALLFSYQLQHYQLHVSFNNNDCSCRFFSTAIRRCIAPLVLYLFIIYACHSPSSVFPLASRPGERGSANLPI